MVRNHGGGGAEREQPLYGKSATYLQLAGLVRELFKAQPRRKFIHAFQLCGHIFRAWRFDRAGALGSEPFSVHEQPKRLLTVLLDYARVQLDSEWTELVVDLGGWKVAEADYKPYTDLSECRACHRVLARVKWNRHICREKAIALDFQTDRRNVPESNSWSFWCHPCYLGT